MQRGSWFVTVVAAVGSECAAIPLPVDSKYVKNNFFVCIVYTPVCVEIVILFLFLCVCACIQFLFSLDVSLGSATGGGERSSLECRRRITLT